ncbi:MAG: hypothetical protein ACREXW_06355 [Gammaproteobacteria bacterium]
MAQNIISLNYTDADLTTIDEGLALLKQSSPRSPAFRPRCGGAS